MEPKRGIFATDVDSYAKGGGVYVEAGGVFNMFGGEVSKNATRSFFKNWKNDRIYHAYSEGGGIYLEGSQEETCLLYTSPSPRDAHESRMPSSA